MTSVLESFWSHFGFGIREQIREMEFKILAPILENCFLHYGLIADFTNDSVVEKAAASFSWQIDAVNYVGFLVPNGEKIIERVDEPVWDFSKYCDFKNDRVILKKIFKNDVCFNLTKMGKYLISKFRDPNVRIVKFYLRELIPKKDMIGSQLYMVDLKKNGFIKIICENRGEELGYILVKSAGSGKRQSP